MQSGVYVLHGHRRAAGLHTGRLWITKAAEQGNAPAEAVVGDLNYLGEGVPKDFSQAAYWYRKAADAGIIHGQFSLGEMFSNGYGVPQDKAQAAVWYRKAAEQGYASAQLSLGSLYVLGQGVPQDYAEAYFWMDLAAAGKIHEVRQEGVAKMRDNAAYYTSPPPISSRGQERAQKSFEGQPVKVGMSRWEILSVFRREQHANCPAAPSPISSMVFT